jgi:glycosyltransferase involved in cell wall biosynthesis
MALSEWHKASLMHYHPQLHPDQILITRNGIDPKRFRGRPVERNMHRAFYSSSPDRGLEVAIKLWPRIRKRVPDAELHVYYGFDNWKKQLAECGDEGLRHVCANLEHGLTHTAGVVYHGRVNQQQLADAQLGSGVWCYPTWFTETSCITAMEAQAAGCHVVTSDRAALKETVFVPGSVKIDGDWMSPESHAAFEDAMVAAMESPGPATGAEEAQHRFDWDGVAAEWLELFGTIEDEIPPYKGLVGL